nr:hypothetical protein [Tanacetum cinerariifolium]
MAEMISLGEQDFSKAGIEDFEALSQQKHNKHSSRLMFKRSTESLIFARLRQLSDSIFNDDLAMIGDVELEEREACCDYNIDQRIEDVMGPFQNHFEGLVTIESLVWGDYGSFLPMYKHPPLIISQTQPLQIVLNFSTCHAPNNHRLEGALLNPVTPVSLISHAVVSNRKDVVPSQNTLPVNVSAIKNASKNEATTSNLANPRCWWVSIESPGCVLRDMTSIFVPSDHLVSPLSESLLCLTKVDRILETKVALPVNQFVDASSLCHEEVKQIEVKEDLTNKSQGKMSKVSIEFKADKEAKRNTVPVKKRETKGECVSKESRESIKRSSIEHNEETRPMAVTKGLSLDSKRSSKGSIALSVCKTEPNVSKHTIFHSEKKVGRKVSQGINELPSKRKNKLTSVQSTGISSSELVKLKSRSRLSLGAIKDKSSIKGIVKVWNIYKDLFDTEVEDQNKQTNLIKSPICNGIVNGKNVKRNESCTVMSDTQQTQVAPTEAVSRENWVACDQCNVWRLLPIGITVADLPKKWWCSKSTWLHGKNYCDVSQDETTQGVHEMNFKISSQNHVIGDTYHTNSNANFETMPNGWKTNKSRPKGSNSKQVETSHSLMDGRQKRKRSGNACKKRNLKDQDCGIVKDLSVASFLKEYASSQTAMTAFEQGEESKDYADRLKISGFDYECNDAYFDSTLKFLHAASLLEAYYNDFSKLKGMVDPLTVYRTFAKLSNESPSSSASDVDNLNNQATIMDKTMLSKNVIHLGNQVVARSQANFTRLLDFRTKSPRPGSPGLGGPGSPRLGGSGSPHLGGLDVEGCEESGGDDDE